MERADIRDEIARALAELLQVDAVALTDATRAEDVDGWDSLAHLKLIVALEELFEVRFGVQELTAPGNVGDLIDLILQLRQAA